MNTTPFGNVKVVAVNGTGTIRTIPYNNTQEVDRKIGNDGKEYFNKNGAIEKAKSEIARWEASDEFAIGDLKYEVQ